MPKYVIERDIPGIGAMAHVELCQAAKQSNDALATLGNTRAQWQHSYRTQDKVFCVYIAEDESAIEDHSKLSGFPVTAISQVVDVIDPTTGES